ncbi:uncharacterized protein PgNI_08707 [Pyricularia grisea]|uniref:Uncharacterized protein n=1 Tax=Pyricularia grisea TaxID=148305 RepID=A0A6P8AUB9_PYRGI|nr:uncharacterized protein PgNI_08707 [Pyricularia grisea]TLD05818.1 hypothetical protein PgNI_08707 [Pyricularia grisea]
MFDKVAVQRMSSGEVVLGGVDWAICPSRVLHCCWLFGASSSRRGTAGQVLGPPPGQTRVPAQVCAKWDVERPLHIVLGYCGHGSQNERIGNPTKASSMGGGALSVTCPRVGLRTRPAVEELHRSRAANFCGTSVCAAAGAALMRTAHVALYFGGAFTILFPCWFLIIQLGRLYFVLVRLDPPDIRGVALLCLKKMLSQKGARTAVVPTS